ncbi:lytic murein transglycosylase [Anianabacter salinae]|uniref:lytic murein transglycosylase n=1 Tax=Anianabacter salinae TaxID=2851023 RepID=UPI00225E1B45|nr:lytic murein transglycosylase [Anianabacter salinae]MBV0912373.1 lytic murein transglycosylase [Anianabacter salinae]
MQANRRAVLGWIGMAGLSACGGLPGPIASFEQPAQTQFRPVPNPAFDDWVAAFRGRAAARGIPEATLAQAFRGAGFLPDVIDRDRNQTEFTRTLEDYLAIVANDERVQTGRAKYAQFRDTLAAIEARHGVEAHVVAAIWGVESRFGARRGDIPVISATATLAFDGRRGAFFEDQLMAALRILQKGDITPDRMTGSWAGAMGHTQFIPTSYQAYAQDFDGDGRRDIWSEDPSDALASTAAYLARSGWQSGRPWGLEVSLPAGFDTGLAGRGSDRAVAFWADRGLRLAGGGAVPDHGAASLLIPDGVPGPAFLVFRNFTAISRYNNAINYVIGVGHLSDRIRGGGPLQAGFGPDRYGLTLEDRKRLQAGLTAAGFDAGTPDGVLGTKTTAAIEAYQRAAGLAVTGEPSQALLSRLG